MIRFTDSVSKHVHMAYRKLTINYYVDIKIPGCSDKILKISTQSNKN